MTSAIPLRRTRALVAVAHLILVRPTKPLFLVITFLALLVTPAHARVSETVKQVEARYGKPQKVFIDRPALRKIGYGYHGFMIIVYYVGGVSKRESFGRPDVPKLPCGTIDQLLALSARPGTSWQPVRVQEGDSHWVSSDKKVIAHFAAPGNVFLVQDRNFKSSE
jgi:hypothetical protein